jgi:hypothetical protein
MKETILDILRFSFILIKENKGKIITTILLFLSIWGIERMDEYNYSEYKLVSSITHEGSMVNQPIDVDKSLGWIINTGENKIKILKNGNDGYSFKDGNLILKSTNDGFVFLIIIIVILSGILLGGTFSSDSDINWNIKEISRDFLYSKVKKFTESGFSYYSLYGKLLFKLDNNIKYNNWEIKDNIEESIKFYQKNKNLFEDWEPLSKKREKQLEEILK